MNPDGAEDVFQGLFGGVHRLEHIVGQNVSRPEGEGPVDHLEHIGLIFIPVRQVAALHSGVDQLCGQGNLILREGGGEAAAVVVLVVVGGDFGAVGGQGLPLLGTVLEELAAQLGVLKEQGPAGLRLVGSGQNNFVRKGLAS